MDKNITDILETSVSEASSARELIGELQHDLRQGSVLTPAYIGAMASAAKEKLRRAQMELERLIEAKVNG